MKLVALTFLQQPRSKLNIKTSDNCTYLINLFGRWLTKRDEFKFEYTKRDSSFLPKEYTAAEGETCYFLDGYKHAGVDESVEVQTHIDAAMEQINTELKN